MKIQLEPKRFIIERALATRSAQQNLALIWIWALKTLAQWTAAITSFETKELAVIDAKTTVNNLQGIVDAKLDELHELTVKVLTMLRTKLELTNPNSLHTVEVLSAVGDSRISVVEEAKELASAWKDLEPTWEPVPDLTLEEFQAKLAAADVILNEYLDARTAVRTAVGEWNGVAGPLNRDCVAWYRDATIVFPEGTGEGDMIRSIVPTTTEFTPFPDQALVVVNEPPGPGAYSVNLEAEHATKFDVYQKGPEETEFTKVGVDVPPGLYVKTGLPAGGYEVKGQGRNSRGAGPDSEPAGITVT